MTNLDIKLFYAINGLAQKSVFWDQVFIYLNKASMVMFTLVLVYYLFKNRRTFWAAALSAILSRGILTELIRFFYHRSRPFVALENVNFLGDGNLVLKIDQSNASFPSGHAAYLFAVAFAVYLSADKAGLYDKKIGGILIVAATVLSFARIYVGVHYPLDILGGAAIAGLSVFLVHKLKNK